jgi:hypothetical protein
VASIALFWVIVVGYGFSQSARRQASDTIVVWNETQRITAARFSNLEIVTSDVMSIESTREFDHMI